MRIIIHDEEPPIPQKDVPEDQWYISRTAFTKAREWAETLEPKQAANRTLAYVRRRKEGESMWAVTYMGTEVYAYPSEDVYRVTIKRDEA